MCIYRYMCTHPPHTHTRAHTHTQHTWAMNLLLPDESPRDCCNTWCRICTQYILKNSGNKLIDERTEERESESFQREGEKDRESEKFSVINVINDFGEKHWSVWSRQNLRGNLRSCITITRAAGEYCKVSMSGCHSLPWIVAFVSLLLSKSHKFLSLANSNPKS